MRQPGGDLAIKVFAGDSASKLVLYILTGAPNPYIWNEAAIRCAQLRRQIMASLCQYWFGGKVRVANAMKWDWNTEQKAYELHTEFVTGRPAALHTPFSAARDHEQSELVEDIMKPLQKRLREAGCDGLLWQAGYGNPVAANNLLRVDEDGGYWAWIDMESGVPALAAMNPLALFGYYIPMCFKHRRPLFDDMDTERLLSYLQEEAEGLRRTVGGERYDGLLKLTIELAEQQNIWRGQRRAHRSIEYQRCKDRITEEQAEYYKRHVLFWYGREAGRALAAVPRNLLKLPFGLIQLLGRIRPMPALRAVGKLLVSQRHREIVARLYTAQRIERWEHRGHINESEGRFLHGLLESKDDSAYITDFGMHIAIKPFVKFFTWGIVPALMASQVVSLPVGGVLMVFGGMIGRTIYTSYRIIGATFSGGERPWVALFAGFLPVLGNAAFPIQILASGTERDGKLAQFIVYDTLSRIALIMPIWGGPDTRVEFFFNGFGNWIARDRGGVDKYLQTRNTSPEPGKEQI
ncbi:MAG: hypothetical protein R3352_01665 [Salinisphaeraceae bacterium]|nr:hypothetical protein [Salinisphaeraceae bacterium]